MPKNRTKTAYETLTEFQEKYPELTFDNVGYQYLSKKVQEGLHKEIKEIESILKKEILGFVQFNHFKPRRAGDFDIRCQYNWGAEEGRSFIGVGYFNIKEFIPIFKNLKVK